MHTIRIAGPWQVFVEGEPDRRVKLPAEWAELGVAGDRMTLRRRFNRPTGLTESHRVWLCVAVCEASLTVALDGKEIARASDSPVRCDISAMSGSPVLTIDVDVSESGDRSGVYGEVWLEIEESAGSDAS